MPISEEYGAFNANSVDPDQMLHTLFANVPFTGCLAQMGEILL